MLQDIPDYAPGTQKNVSGEVIRWNNISGPEKMDAKKYIEILEAEIEELNRQVGRQSSNAQNELLEYLKSLEPRNLKVDCTFLCHYRILLHLYPADVCCLLNLHFSVLICTVAFIVINSKIWSNAKFIIK
jgi:hypothetical protein